MRNRNRGNPHHLLCSPAIRRRITSGARCALRPLHPYHRRTRRCDDLSEPKLKTRTLFGTQFLAAGLLPTDHARTCACPLRSIPEARPQMPPAGKRTRWGVVSATSVTLLAQAPLSPGRRWAAALYFGETGCHALQPCTGSHGPIPVPCCLSRSAPTDPRSIASCRNREQLGPCAVAQLRLLAEPVRNRQGSGGDEGSRGIPTGGSPRRL